MSEIFYLAAALASAWVAHVLAEVAAKTRLCVDCLSTLPLSDFGAVI